MGLVSALAYGALFAVHKAYGYATGSPRFEVRGLAYAPTPHVPIERMRELLALSPGTNLLGLDLDEVVRRIEAEPWVRKAEAVRRLPDTLIVEVEEHEAAAVLLADGFYLVSRDGRAFKKVGRGERGDLPIVTGIGDGLLAGDRSEAERRIARGLEALGVYRQKARPRLGEIHVGPGGSLTLHTAERGTELRLGRGPIAAKIERFDALRAALGERAEQLGVVHLDVESPSRVIARFIDDASPEREGEADHG
jgi:cell division protein FtsQ